MYKGYKTYRHYLNAKVHALSYLISGDKTILEEELNSRGLKTIKELSLQDIEILHKQLSEVIKNLGKTYKKNKMSINQKRAIIKIARYDFGWSDDAIFSYILEMYPEKRKKLNNWEISKSKLSKLFTLLTLSEADKVIKRLDKIKQRNKQMEAKNNEKSGK